MRVSRVEVRLPLRELGYVNSYVIGDPGSRGYVIVDPGMYWAEGLESLARGLSRLGLRLCDAEGVVATHFHVDHVTAAVLIASVCSTDVYMGDRELAYVRKGFESYFNGVLELYGSYGVPKELLDSIRSVHLVPKFAKVYDELADLALPLHEGAAKLGDVSLRVVETPGHTPGHITALLDDGSAIVGDLVLKEITPSIILDSRSPGRNPLGEYLGSLAKLKELGPRLLRPGHGDCIEDPRVKIDELVRHHKERLEEVLNIVMSSADPPDLVSVASRVRWRTSASSWSDMKPYDKYFALGETLAHLRALELEGLVEEVGDPPRFRPA